MSDPIDPKAYLNLVEMTIDSMYELEAIGELLEQKGVMTKEEIIALAKDLKRKKLTAEARTAAPTDTPAQQRFTDTDNAVIGDHGCHSSTWPLGSPSHDAFSPNHSVVGMGQAGCT